MRATRATGLGARCGDCPEEAGLLTGPYAKQAAEGGV